MFNQHFCGIIIKQGDIKQDHNGNTYREIQFQEVNQNKSFDDRMINVRMYDRLDLNIFDMVFCMNYRIYKQKDSINQIRLERNWFDSYECGGNDECEFLCDVRMFGRMKTQQEQKRKCQNKQVQSRIDHYFRQ